MKDVIHKNEEKVYTHHGEKRTQGQLITNNGKKALGFFEKGKIIGYTYLDELLQDAYTKDLPDYNLDF